MINIQRTRAAVNKVSHTQSAATLGKWLGKVSDRWKCTRKQIKSVEITLAPTCRKFRIVFPYAGRLEARREFMSL